MSVLYGYAGKLLEVNLSENRFKDRVLQEKLCRDYLGGIGFNARYLYEQIPTGADALGPENILMISAGTLVGSPFPTASRSEASAKSPMTGLFGTSNSGMFFGIQLKCAGYDGIIIRGQAPEPVYLVIENEEVKVYPAGNLWGKDAWEALDILKTEYEEAEIALIGPAGENMVRFACIENGYYDAWGRTGLGAVMGSKRLKAIVVRGSGSITPFKGEEMLQKTLEARKRIMASPFYQPFKSYGTMNAAIPYGKFQALNAHHFTRGCLPDWKQNFARSRVEEYMKSHIACQSCIIACAHWVEINQGKYQGLKMKDMEVTPVTSFGSGLGLSLEACVQASAQAQKYGYDMVSIAGTVGMAIELFRHGMLTREDIGYDIDFGQEKAIFQLMEDIAYRRGIGHILAEGSKRAAGILTGSEDAAVHIKGLEMPMIDPRGRWTTWTLGMLTNIRGGDHLRCRNPVENLRYNENKHNYRKERFGFPEKMFHDLDMPAELKARAIDLEQDTVDIAVMAKWAEDLINLYNALGVCIRPPVMNSIGPGILAPFFEDFTGLTMSPADLMRAAERAWNVMKLFNIREGEKPEDSRFPERFYRQAIDDKVLPEEQIEEVLKLYYQARGWDRHSGQPQKEKLEELSLEQQRYFDSR